MSSILSTSVLESVKEQVSGSIDKKRLSAEMLEIIFDHNWFNLWVPTVYGGLGFKLSEGCRLLEELAYVDGGLSWTVTLCSGANMFAGYIDPCIAKQIFSERKTCWGGSGMASGTAEEGKDGYTLNGSWKYATGAPHLTHFTLNAIVIKDGKQCLDKEGNPRVHSFFIRRDDVMIHDDWDTFGLECTASHSFTVQNMVVPHVNCFDLVYEKRKIQEPLFDYPFSSFAECTLGVNYIGMAKRFLDLFEKQLFVKSTAPNWDNILGKMLFKHVDSYRTHIESVSSHLYALMEESWGEGVPPAEKLQQISSTTENIVLDIKTMVMRLFPYTGIAGAQKKNEINIVFRNLFTASQHALLNRKSIVKEPFFNQ